jgi:hypothetical protein
MILAAIAMLAAQQQIAVDEEALRAGAPVVRQLLEEAPDAYYQADPGRTTFVIATRQRQTNVGGICGRDQVKMVMAPPGERPAAPAPRRARIRELEVDHQFHVLRTEDGAPRWDLTGDALEDACAGTGDGAFHWIEAESADEARAGVLGLLAVVRALGERDSPLIRFHCSGARCFDRAQVASLIEPFQPANISSRSTRRCGAGGRYRCQIFFVVDIALCGGWQLEAESAWEEPFRLRSATFIKREGIAIHCGGEDS